MHEIRAVHKNLYDIYQSNKANAMTPCFTDPALAVDCVTLPDLMMFDEERQLLSGRSPVSHI